RVANSVRYDTANLSGFTASFQYGAQGNNYAQPGAPIVTTGNTPHASVFGANALYNNGPISLGVGYEGNYGVRGRALPCTGGGLVVSPDTKAIQWELTYTNPLSKRTLLYTGYNKIANKNNAAYNFNINPYNPVSSTDQSYATPGGKPAGLVFGMVHFF